MSYAIRYVETEAEIAADIEAVRESAGKGWLDLLGCTPEEYVEGWGVLFVCDERKQPIDEAWSLGGVERYEAYHFATHADAEAWIAAHGATEPGGWEIWEV